MAIDLSQYENGQFESIAEAIGQIYKGKVIEVYWGEDGGNVYYSDFDMSQNMYIEGRVLWGRGNVFALEVEYETNNNKYKKHVMCNAWRISFVAEKDDDFKLIKTFKGRV